VRPFQATRRNIFPRVDPSRATVGRAMRCEALLQIKQKLRGVISLTDPAVRVLRM